MISVLRQPLFILASIAFWINQFLERVLNVFIPVYHSYGDDLMAMPVVFGLCLQIMRWIHPLKNRLTFTRSQILVGLTYFALVFEGVLPLLSERYTADLLDVLCYVMGSVAFYYFMNHPIKTQSPFPAAHDPID